jgi:NHL repeat
MSLRVGMLVALLVAAPAWGQLKLPPGFTAEVYLTGQGFDPASERGVRGFPASATLGFDHAGVLYLAKTGARFRAGEVEDLNPVYRVLPGGARLTPESEGRFTWGPPLRNPQIAAVRGSGDVFVTTYDRDRRLGAIYRIRDGRAGLFAGGTPAAGSPPLLRQPEGIALDRAGNVYVADREEGVVLQLDPGGKVLSPRYAALRRPRFLACDETGTLWIGGDGTAETPIQDGTGEIWRVGPDGAATLALQGPLPAGLTLSPGGAVVVAQRRTGSVFVVTPEGGRLDFATGGGETTVRTLAFAPVTPETRRHGIAGELFVVTLTRQAWAVNEVIRVSGPFDEWVRRERPAP